MKNISVVSPWHGATAQLWSAFAVVTTGIDELIIVDDGVDEATATRFEKHAGVRVVKNATNLGFAGSCNAGYASSTGDVIAFINSDVESAAQTESQRMALRRALSEVPEGALVGPEIKYQTLWACSVPYVDGWLVAARRATWEQLVIAPHKGPWDAASFATPYWEDVDLSLRAHLAGIRVIEAVDWRMYVRHLGGQTMGSSARWGESYEKNRKVVAERARPLWKNLTFGGPRGSDR